MWIEVLKAFGVLAVLGLLFGVLLGVAAKKFAVKVDPRIEQVRACLGGANCGACGFAGCDAFAEAVVTDGANPAACTPGGVKTAEAIGAIMGVEVTAEEPKVARVICNGTDGIVKERYEYDGYTSCRVAASMAGGPKLCSFSCIGLGDCTKVCPSGAITLNNGIAAIDGGKCIGCGECVNTCPRAAIQMLPRDAKVIVRCRNSDTGRVARAACMKACIACQRCVKECKYGAITVENGFARIDYSKCTRCGECAKVCPCGCISVNE